MLRLSMAAIDSGCRLEIVTLAPDATISEAIARLEQAGTGALLLNENGKLFGILTDGDVRRAILRGLPLDRPCSAIASRQPVIALPDTSPAEALRLMNDFDVNHLPVVGRSGQLVNLILRRDLVPEGHAAPTAVIMAGGFGTRL